MTSARSAAPAARLDVLAECGSTNTELVQRAAQGWPDFSVVATASQTAGRGRLGRVWSAPPGQTLAVSVLLRPAFGIQAFGWLPLIAGLAMTNTVEALLRTDAAPAPEVTLKWPNDVQVRGLKVCGILAELLPGADGVVVGAGLNLSIPADALPTPVSTSLTLEGAPADDMFERALGEYLQQLRALYDRLRNSGGDAVASGLHETMNSRCATVGRRVRVELADGVQHGTATGVDTDGRLLLLHDSDGQVQAVATGDVTHLRYE